MNQKYDVIILGGGQAGLSLSLQLREKDPDLSILVLEKGTHPVPDAAHKIGESLVDLASHYYENVLNLREHLKADQLPKLGLRYFFKTGKDGDDRVESRFELGLQEFAPFPTYQVDRGRFENYLGQCAQDRGIEFMDGSRVESVDLAEDDSDHSVAFVRHGETQTVTARWIVDATGRSAFLKRKLDLAAPYPHHVNSVWFRIRDKIDLNEWGGSDAWTKTNQGAASRWFSTNHLMGTGYWVWLIPLSIGHTSIGIVAEESFHPFDTINTFEKALTWLKRHEPQCGAEVEKRRDLLVDYKVMKQFTHSCKQIFSPDRWCLAGESGAFLDPFYSPGSDYIAMCCTCITEIIATDRTGGNYRMAANLYNLIYTSLFVGNMEVYRDQYEIFEHPTVMPVKILWDFAFYWSYPAYLFVHHKFEDLQWIISMKSVLQEIGILNTTMQTLFREWSRREPLNGKSGYFDYLTIGFLKRLNKNLGAELTASEVESTFLNSIEALKSFAREMTAYALARHPELESDARRSIVQSGADSSELAGFIKSVFKD